MPAYDMKCTNCGKDDFWKCSISEYDERKKTLTCECGGNFYQVMGQIKYILKGEGWSAPNTIQGSGYHKPGSQEDLDDALRENDHLEEKAEKDDKWRKARDQADELRYKQS
jgi:predicted nucleic acid-binding Zn ribbon protein